jgi:chemotaxis methyl-accepting protein methylase
MRKLLLSFVLMLSIGSLLAQKNGETIYKDWEVFPEGKNAIEVSYRILECQGINQVHFKLFNSGETDQQVEFLVTVKTSETTVFTKTVRFNALKRNIVEASCSAISLDALKLDLHKEIEPNKVSVSIMYKSRN